LPQPGPGRADIAAQSGSSPMMTTLVMVVVVASLYFGREIFVPIALSILLSFALAPPVRWLRAVHVPRIAAVLIVVSLAFAFIAAFATVVAWQVGDLAQRLPTYQRNIEAKIDSFREGPPGGALFGRASQMIRDLGRRIEETQEAEPDTVDAPPAGPAGDAAATEREPLLVEVQEPTPGAMQTLQTILVPLVSPLATAGIVIVFVIFMLLKREDLRDRVLRLFGSRDLSRTTEALDDAAHRVGHYLLMQLVVNVTYGIPIALGFWLIGLPNPVLWGMLATVLRFVPYIGPIISSVFPLALAIAVDPGWSTLVWVAGLIIFIELISNNAVEPWLYGTSTGLSPVAIIVAAIFWTWLWGPIGLLLSTPLTVCLLVLGQHVPQLKFLDVLFGSDAVLTPSETLYHRLLVGDPDEATERAEHYLDEHSLAGFFDQVAVPALAMAEKDRARRALDDERLGRVAESLMILVDNLSEYEEHERAAGRRDDAEASELAADPAPPADPVPAGTGLVLCAGARGSLDEAAASMLSHLLERRGANARTVPCASLQSARLRELDVGDVAVVVLSYMNPDSLAHARFLIRRLRRRFPGASIIVGFWTFTPEEIARRDPLAATGADRVATSLNIAVDDVVERLTTGTLQRREPQVAAVELPDALPAAAE
jgi:predicted PurR-regulated permease PerM